MKYPSRVAESDGGDKLLKVFPGTFLFQSPFSDFIEQLTPTNIFHHKIDFGLGGHDLEELNDVGVSDASEDGDLALDVSDEAALEDLLLINDLDGDPFAGLNIAGMVDLSERAMAEELADLEATQQEAICAELLVGAASGGLAGDSVGH